MKISPCFWTVLVCQEFSVPPLSRKPRQPDKDPARLKAPLKSAFFHCHLHFAERQKPLVLPLLGPGAARTAHAHRPHKRLRGSQRSSEDLKPSRIFDKPIDIWDQMSLEGPIQPKYWAIYDLPRLSSTVSPALPFPHEHPGSSSSLSTFHFCLRC